MSLQTFKCRPMKEWVNESAISVFWSALRFCDSRSGFERVLWLHAELHHISTVHLRGGQHHFTCQLNSILFLLNEILDIWTPSLGQKLTTWVEWSTFFQQSTMASHLWNLNPAVSQSSTSHPTAHGRSLVTAILCTVPNMSSLLSDSSRPAVVSLVWKTPEPVRALDLGLGMRTSSPFAKTKKMASIVDKIDRDMLLSILAGSD